MRNPQSLKLQISERALMAFLLFALTFAFPILYMNRYITDSYCWNEFATALYQMGKMPYRDFYLYYPPALIVKYDIIMSLFGTKIIWVALAGILNRSVIMTVLYAMFSKLFRPLYAFVTLLISYLVLLCGPFDTVGDYSWLSLETAIFSLFFLQLFFEYAEKRKSTARIFMILCFAFAIQSVMSKQSTGVLYLFALVLFCFIYTICQRFSGFFGDSAAAALGVFLGGAPWIAWLYKNNALSAFFHQVYIYALNSKGVSGSSAGSSNIIRTLGSIFSFKYLVIFICLLMLLFCTKKQSQIHKNIRLISITAIFVIVWMELVDAVDINVLFQKAIWANGLFAIALLFLVNIVFKALLSGKQNDVLSAAAIAFSFFIMWVMVSLTNTSLIRAICDTNIVAAAENVISHASFLFCIALCVRYSVSGFLGHADGTMWKKFSIAVCNLANGFSILSGSGVVTNYTGFICFISISLVLCILLEQSEMLHVHLRMPFGIKEIILHAEKYALGVLGVLIAYMMLVTAAGKLNAPYSWWGIPLSSITEDDYYSIDNSLYEGMYVSKETKVKIEEMGKLIGENSSENDYVLCFPYSVLYKLQTRRFYQPTKTLVYFFDVCSDEMAISDLEIIKKNYPKIIVWMDVGEDCWNFHEYAFRGGARMGQRDIRDWFESVKDVEYQLIGNIGNQYVYRIKDGTPINYTYFADEEKIISDRNEVLENIRDSGYALKAANKLEGLSGLDASLLYGMICFLLVLGCVMTFASSKRAELFFISLLCTIYLIMPCKPIVLSGFVIPLVVSLSDSVQPFRKRAWYAIPMAVVTVSSVLGWWDIWDQIEYIVFACVAFLYLISVAFSFDYQWKPHMRISLQHVKLDRQLLAYGVSVVILAGAFSINRYALMSAWARQNNENDFLALQEIYNDVYYLSHDENFSEIFSESASYLTELSGGGVNLAELSEYMETRGVMMDRTVNFQSKELKHLNAGNVYIRYAEGELSVWIQEDSAIGNFSHAISIGNYGYLIPQLYKGEE